VFASACTGSGYLPYSSELGGDAAVSGDALPSEDPDDDRDHDGVCNGTEIALASNPERADTDGDGFPDFTEVMANYVPTNPVVPNPDQVTYLSGSSESTVDFEVRMTVDGAGLGYTGEFRPDASPDPRGISAKDFFLGAEAVGGQPTDNVRGVDAEGERFNSVLGKTRVSFRLHFALGRNKAASCAIGYPFEYRLKDDNGRYSAARSFMLVVTPADERLNANGGHTFCVPASCI
jgi:hypothetical protein